MQLLHLFFVSLQALKIEKNKIILFSIYISIFFCIDFTKMTEEHLKLLVELENRINKLMEMVDSTNARLQHAEADYQTKNTELMYAHRRF